ncbi:MAG: NPCBM/NEW2 domain-containing protein [Kiritimatiellae bacterium]|nr:NPCBM/NEW2 domain-containing protein [Kiritimatiellia bacterium]MDD5522424.1 NPCBM/NEW2 domain-containing protein [Kiritimatiellia bacterium]
MRSNRCLVTALITSLAVSISYAETVWISSFGTEKIQQSFGKPQADKTIENNKITIGGQVFDHGIGTHANSIMMIDLKGGSERFSANVGVDDETGRKGSAEFSVIADKKVLWKSGVMKGGQSPQKVDVDVKGIKILMLCVGDAGDGIDHDHADWADAKLEVTGEKPQIMSPQMPQEQGQILTPKPDSAPRITGPKIFGVRPDAPFLFRVTSTGIRPMKFSAKGLPRGLVIDRITGQITGSVNRAGEYIVTLSVENAIGKAKRSLKIIVGDRIALTPPMGWNSWNCWAAAVDADKVLRSAKTVVSSGLADHGWTYINIDDTWQGKRGGEFKALQGNQKFPDMKGLCDTIHGMGLKIGIYSTPWITSYAGFAGSSSYNEKGEWNEQTDSGKWVHGKFRFHENDARQWAAWGIDYLKYDWHVLDVPHVSDMATALRWCRRDILYSLSNSAPFEHADDWARLANCWRTTGDITDTWESMSGIGFSQDKWKNFAGPGHWNDPDMLVVGHVGWGPRLHPTKLTPNEQYTHISLWCLLSAPLLLGCDLEKLDDFTLNLLTNDEVLDVNQDPLGKQAGRISAADNLEVWAKDLEDGSKAVGLFNRGYTEASVTAKWQDLGISGKQTVRDLWRQKDVGEFSDQFSSPVSPHGAVLIKITQVK